MMQPIAGQKSCDNIVFFCMPDQIAEGFDRGIINLSVCQSKVKVLGFFHSKKCDKNQG